MGLKPAVTMQLAQTLKSEGFTFIAVHPGAEQIPALRCHDAWPFCKFCAVANWV